MKQKLSYSEAKQIADEIKRRFKFTPANVKSKIVGSILRKEPIVHDIDFLVILPKEGKEYYEFHLTPKKAGDMINSFEIYSTGDMHAQILFNTSYKTYKVDFFTTTKYEYPFALYHYTGPKIYNIRSRAQAKRHGLILNQYGLFDSKTKKPVNHVFKTERDIMNYLGLTYRTPENRK